MLNEPEFNDFVGPVERNLEPIEEASLAKDGNDARRVAEAGVEWEGYIVVNFDPHVHERGGDVPVTDPAVKDLRFGDRVVGLILGLLPEETGNRRLQSRRAPRE
jgi:hypothetical protein